jgi:hypothetical protein
MRLYAVRLHAIFALLLVLLLAGGSSAASACQLACTLHGACCMQSGLGSGSMRSSSKPMSLSMSPSMSPSSTSTSMPGRHSAPAPVGHALPVSSPLRHSVAASCVAASYADNRGCGSSLCTASDFVIPAADLILPTHKHASAPALASLHSERRTPLRLDPHSPPAPLAARFPANHDSRLERRPRSASYRFARQRPHRNIQRLCLCNQNIHHPNR